MNMVVMKWFRNDKSYFNLDLIIHLEGWWWRWKKSNRQQMLGSKCQKQKRETEKNHKSQP